MADCSLLSIMREFGFPVTAFFVMVWIMVYQRKQDMDGITKALQKLNDNISVLNEGSARLQEREDQIMGAIHELAKQNNSMIQVLVELARELGRRNHYDSDD